MGKHCLDSLREWNPPKAYVFIETLVIESASSPMFAHA